MAASSATSPTVSASASPGAPVRYLCALADSPEAKIEAVARTICGASEIAYSRAARCDLEQIRRLGYERIPICIAETHLKLGEDGGNARQARAPVLPVVVM